VVAGTTPVLVHNIKNECDVPRLERSAEFHHSQLDPIAQEQRDTVVMSTENGPDLVGAGVRDVNPGQRADIGGSELEVRLPGHHAEVTVVQRAEDLGLKPRNLLEFIQNDDVQFLIYIAQRAYSAIDELTARQMDLGVLDATRRRELLEATAIQAELIRQQDAIRSLRRSSDGDESVWLILKATSESLAVGGPPL
jgi:hypothetical protein